MTCKRFMLTVFGISSCTIILSLFRPDSWMAVSDRLFLYGMGLLVFAALMQLFSGKFGFVIVRGFRLLFKGTPLDSYSEGDTPNKGISDAFKSDLEKAASTNGRGRWLMLAAFIAGFINVFLAIILILLFS